MALEILISVKVNTVPEAHAVIAALHSVSANNPLFKHVPKTLTMMATDCVPEGCDTLSTPAPASSIQSSPVAQTTPHYEDEDDEEDDLVEESTTAKPRNDTPPDAPVSRLYQSVVDRITAGLRAGKQPHKDDRGQAALMWHKDMLTYNIDTGYGL